MSAHDVFTETLQSMRGPMNDRIPERDLQPAHLYDAAEDEDRAYDDWRQRQDDEREMRLEEALNAAKNAGVDVEHLRVLAFEAGATHWALVNSLKG